MALIMPTGIRKVVGNKAKSLTCLKFFVKDTDEIFPCCGAGAGGAAKILLEPEPKFLGLSPAPGM
jgi:hypothetical protein